MTIAKNAFKNERLIKAITGLGKKEFDDLLKGFEKEYEQQRKRNYKKKERQRLIGGGRKGALLTIEEKLLFILCFYKTYPTYDVLGFMFKMDRSNACKNQQRLTKILEKVLKKKLVLPKRKITSIEDFLKIFPETKEIFIDGTERPIQRSKNNEIQKQNYSGKKKRHTRKNLIISTKQKRVNYLSSTVEGKKSDFALLKQEIKSKCFPKNIHKHIDLGFQGFEKEYDSNISIPQKKPRTKELTKLQKIQNTKKANTRILVEHAIGGIKRFGIVSQIFRNRIKDFDDTVMLICCGLWNYHLDFNDSKC